MTIPEEIIAELETIQAPQCPYDIYSMGLIRKIEILGNKIEINVLPSLFELPCHLLSEIKKKVAKIVGAMEVNFVVKDITGEFGHPTRKIKHLLK